MSTTIITKQGQTIDLVCLLHYGRTAEVTEMVLNANPDVASLGAVLPIGTRLLMPATPSRQSAPKLTSLWE